MPTAENKGFDSQLGQGCTLTLDFRVEKQLRPGASSGSSDSCHWAAPILQGQRPLLVLSPLCVLFCLFQWSPDSFWVQERLWTQGTLFNLFQSTYTNPAGSNAPTTQKRNRWKNTRAYSTILLNECISQQAVRLWPSICCSLHRVQFGHPL